MTKETKREGAKALDREGTKMTKDAKREGREGGAPRRTSSRPSRFVLFASLRGFVIQNLRAFVLPTPPAPTLFGGPHE